MKLFHAIILLFSIFLSLNAFNLQAENYSFSRNSDIESFVLEGEKFESDTLKMKKFLEKMDGKTNYKGEIIGKILMAKSYDKVFDKMNATADSLLQICRKGGKNKQGPFYEHLGAYGFCGQPLFFQGL